MAIKRIATKRQNNQKFIKNFSNLQLTDNQVSVISKGLKFVPTPVTNINNIKRQLLQDFEKFARRMHLKYIFHAENKEPHPFHVKSDREPPVQNSVALESYLESVKIQLAEIMPSGTKIICHATNIKLLKSLKTTLKADKGTTTVIRNESNNTEKTHLM